MVEILVSIVLIGTAGIAVLTALQASIVAVRTHDDVAQNQALLAEAADLITDTEPEQIAYVDCFSDPETAYQASIDAAFPPAGTIDVTVTYWNRDVDAFDTTCRYDLGDRLQRIVLTSSVDEVQKEVVVVKRPIAVPTQNTVAAPPVPPYSGGSGQATVSLTPGING